MEVRVPVVTVDLASGPRDISNLGSCRKAHVLFMYRDQPICRREVEVIHGKITGVELALAMNGPGGMEREWDRWAEAVLYRAYPWSNRRQFPNSSALHRSCLYARSAGGPRSVLARPRALDQQRC